MHVAHEDFLLGASYPLPHSEQTTLTFSEEKPLTFSTRMNWSNLLFGKKPYPLQRRRKFIQSNQKHLMLVHMGKIKPHQHNSFVLLYIDTSFLFPCKNK